MENIKQLLSELPHFTEEDVNKIYNNINWIASGSRLKSEQRDILLKEFIEYGREFTQILRDKYGITNKNTNYSSWEYGNHYFSIDIYYVFPSIQYGKFEVNSKEDFQVRISSWRTGNYEHIGFAKTPKEAIKLLNDNDLRNL